MVIGGFTTSSGVGVTINNGDDLPSFFDGGAVRKTCGIRGSSDNSNEPDPSIIGQEPLLTGPSDPFNAAYLFHKHANSTTALGGASLEIDRGQGLDVAFEDWELIGTRCAPTVNGMNQYCEEAGIDFLFGNDVTFDGLFDPFDPAYVLRNNAMTCDKGLGDGACGDPSNLLFTSLFVDIEVSNVGTLFADDAAEFLCLNSSGSMLNSGLVSMGGGGGDSAHLDDDDLDSFDDKGGRPADYVGTISYNHVDEIAASTNGSKTSTSWLVLRVVEKDGCRCFDGFTLAPMDLYDFHEGMCKFPPPSAAVPGDEGRVDQGHSLVFNLPSSSAAVFGDKVDQGPPTVEYLGPFLVLSLTVLGAFWCVDPRHFRHDAQIKWSDVSLRAFLPALAAYLIYYFALMPNLIADALAPSWLEHVIMIPGLAWLAGTTVFLRHYGLAPSKAGKSRWGRCYLVVAGGVSIAVPLGAPLVMASHSLSASMEPDVGADPPPEKSGLRFPNVIVHSRRLYTSIPDAATLQAAITAWCSDSATAEATYGPIEGWDVSRVTSISTMSMNCMTISTFNADLSMWDVGSVTDMSYMLGYGDSFNGDLSAWDVSSVTSMSGMFYLALSFNGDISAWDIGSVTSMNTMFSGTSSFGVVLCWDLSSDMDTMYMFDSSSGSVSSSEAKCSCAAGTYYDGSSCDSCPSGTYSMGKTESCVTCAVGSTLCLGQPSPSPSVTISPTLSPAPTRRETFEPTATPLTSSTLQTAITAWCSDSATAEATYGPIEGWDVSQVGDMSTLVSMYCMTTSTFNADLSLWDVGSVTNMIYMFQNLVSFNGDLSAWDVSSVTAMSGMFSSAPSFNGDLSAWDISSVTAMGYMFSGASSFGVVLCWDLSSVMDTMYMFDSSYGSASTSVAKCSCAAGTYYDGSSCASCLSEMYSMGKTESCVTCAVGSTLCLGQPSPSPSVTISPTLSLAPTRRETFEPTATPLTSSTFLTAITAWCTDSTAAEAQYGHISGWDVSQVGELYLSMYCSTYGTFNEDISAWDVGSMTDMSFMLAYANSFNQDLSAWNVGSVTSMYYAFSKAYSFNGDLSAWDVGSVTSMYFMFDGAGSFNVDLSAWNVANVMDMEGMFYDSTFNQDLSAWDLTSVTNTNYMFQFAYGFSMILCWDVTGIPDSMSMFDSSMGSTSMSEAKCSCAAGTYYNGSSCASCLTGTYSLGMTESCSTCAAGTGSPAGSSECLLPTPVPTQSPNLQPTSAPILAPTPAPTELPNLPPSLVPAPAPTAPTMKPTAFPTSSPTLLATPIPTQSTGAPTITPFTTTTLQPAVTTWCSDSATAEANYGPIANWDVSLVDDMSGLVMTYCSAASATFNGDLSAWDVGSVTTMQFMFSSASSFNVDISAWDVKSVTTMEYMFYQASAFNQDLSLWEVGSVTDAAGMFSSASSFNSDISMWDVGSVTSMGFMFYQAAAFYQDLSVWSLASTATVESMFTSTPDFNVVLCWDLVGITTTDMFTSSSGSVSTSEAKCSCAAGTYYDGSSCASCPAGTYSLGMTESCATCAVGTGSPAGSSVCLAPSPMPTYAPTQRPIPQPSMSPAPTVAPTRKPIPGPTAGPSPSPTLVPSPSPTLVPLPSPTLVPSPSPVASPSPEPTVAALLFDSGTTESVTVAAAGAVGASVAVSVGASVSTSVAASASTSTAASVSTSGASSVSVSAGTSSGSAGAGGGAGGGSGGSSSGSSNAASDPMTLIFLVQAVAVTSKLSAMPSSYSDFAGGFSIFLLQVPLPWVGSDDDDRRRLGANGDDGFFGNDGTEATEVMQGHLFWAALVIIGMTILHGVALAVLNWMATAVPGSMQFPHAEVKVLLAISMGAMDCSFAVLASASTAPGWKLVAATEVVATMTFVGWFITKERDFVTRVRWVPLSNVKRFGMLRWGDDKDKITGYLTQAEVVSMAREAGQTKEQGEALFAELDVNNDGMLDYSEFSLQQELESLGINCKVVFESACFHQFEPVTLALFSSEYVRTPADSF